MATEETETEAVEVTEVRDKGTTRKPDPVWEMTAKQLMAMTNSLVSLSTRTLATLKSEIKVSSLVKHFRGHAEIVEELGKKKRRELVKTDDEGEEVMSGAAALAKAMDEISATKYEVPIPRYRILEEDFPKIGQFKDKDKDSENRSGIADIRANLGQLYTPPDNEGEE